MAGAVVGCHGRAPYVFLEAVKEDTMIVRIAEAAGARAGGHGRAYRRLRVEPGVPAFVAGGCQGRHNDGSHACGRCRSWRPWAPARVRRTACTSTSPRTGSRSRCAGWPARRRRPRTTSSAMSHMVRSHGVPRPHAVCGHLRMPHALVQGPPPHSARLARRAQTASERRSYAAAPVAAVLSGARDRPDDLAEQRGAHRAPADAA